MKQYRGYYIDHVIFNSTAEIDAFIKKQAVEHHNRLSKMFSEHPSMELSSIMSDSADRLHILFGFSYEEIEKMEIVAMV